VTVTGSGFTGATTVSFGTAADPKPTVSNDTQLTAISPLASTAGTVDVTVTTPAGTSATSRADQFTYEQPPTAPIVTGIQPDKGLPIGQTRVIVTGSGFTGATAVSFGTSVAPDIAVTNDTQLIAISPPVSTAGTVDVTVATSAGTSATSAADQFTYLALP
jgi:IPT/TIG domain